MANFQGALLRAEAFILRTIKIEIYNKNDPGSSLLTVNFNVNALPPKNPIYKCHFLLTCLFVNQFQLTLFNNLVA